MQQPMMVADQQRGINRTFIALLFLVALVMAAAFYKQSRVAILNENQLSSLGAVVLPEPRRIQSFQLQGINQPFTEHSLLQKWSLVFFGYTSCPDICPVTLNELDRFFWLLDKKIQQKIQIVFVSVDPYRDQPEVLSKFVRYFNSEIIGVSGENQQLAQLARNLSVPFIPAKISETEFYPVDHGSQIVLINPEGMYHGFFRPPFDPVSMQQAFLSIMAKGY